MLSGDARAFIRASIKSIWGLELLLFLRAHAERSWNVPEMVRELRASDPVVRGSLRFLVEVGAVAEDVGGTVRFAPSSPGVDGAVREIAETYATHPLAVTNEIYSPDSKIQHFADAFRLKKE